jgi:hypothetical protein
MGRRQWGDDSTVCVKLSGNATVSLIFKGNLFDLAPAERELVGALADIIQRHQGLKQDAQSAA